jgi:ankyrin repeat protein
MEIEEMPRTVLRKFGLILAAALMFGAPPVMAQQFSDGYQFLKAVKDRDGDGATKFLKAPGSTVINARDQSTGQTALFTVVQRRDEVWLRFLLDQGANPNIAAYNGATVLGLAVNLGWVEGAERLLNKGANINDKTDTGETPLINAVHQRNIPLIRLLLKHGADADRTDNSGRSARDYAQLLSKSSGVVEAIDQAETERGESTPKTYGPGL